MDFGEKLAEALESSSIKINLDSVDLVIQALEERVAKLEQEVLELQERSA